MAAELFFDAAKINVSVRSGGAEWAARAPALHGQLLPARVNLTHSCSGQHARNNELHVTTSRKSCTLGVVELRQDPVTRPVEFLRADDRPGRGCGAGPFHARPAENHGVMRRPAAISQYTESSPPEAWQNVLSSRPTPLRERADGISPAARVFSPHRRVFSGNVGWTEVLNDGLSSPRRGGGQMTNYLLFTKV
ncbi:hypothetical protein Bbelb_208740 [Branchiostoma belcheri]|nr:hypothetical protein Bbelb_208740 [Branchiostoma belcheri]